MKYMEQLDLTRDYVNGLKRQLFQLFHRFSNEEGETTA